MPWKAREVRLACGQPCFLHGALASFLQPCRKLASVAWTEARRVHGREARLAIEVCTCGNCGHKPWLGIEAISIVVLLLTVWW